TATSTLLQSRDYNRPASLTPPRAVDYPLPSVEYHQAPPAHFWTGGNVSPHFAAPRQHTLPTPPTQDTDVFKPFHGHLQHQTANVATALVQHPHMASGPDALAASSSFTARRSAASGLPTFQLPPPELAGAQKYPPFGTINTSQPASANTGNLLTPPSTLPGDGLTLASSAASNSSLQAYSNGAGAVAFWTAPAHPSNPYSFTSGPTQHAYSASVAPVYHGRPVYSSGPGSATRAPATSAEAMAHSAYDMSHPPFPASMSASSGQIQNFGALAAQQHAIHNAMLSTQAPTTSGPPSQPSPIHAPDHYGARPPPTPTYYNTPQTSSTPQQANFPTYTARSSPQESPLPSTAQAPRSPPSSSSPANPSSTVAQSGSGPSPTGRPYNYPLPAMAGPIMSNMHNPGSQLSIVGGVPGSMMNSYAASQAAMQIYNTPHIPIHQPGLNDRPYKCDQCAQSFNRNHDLKRHKRIHLAVKPFPCGHCDKSFSRKDALKRHVLVKGCGVVPPSSHAANASANAESSPRQKPKAKAIKASEDAAPDTAEISSPYAKEELR
ncbi:MAG: hypothetical protein M1829_002131, partial [Trizodia sp. TS-e1964]